MVVRVLCNPLLLTPCHEVCRRNVRLVAVGLKLVEKGDADIPVGSVFVDIYDDGEIGVVVLRLDDVVPGRERVVGKVQVGVLVGVEADVLIVAVGGELGGVDRPPVTRPLVERTGERDADRFAIHRLSVDLSLLFGRQDLNDDGDRGFRVARLLHPIARRERVLRFLIEMCRVRAEFVKLVHRAGGEVGELLGFLPRVGRLRVDLRFKCFRALPPKQDECVLIVSVPYHHEDVVIGVVLEEGCRSKSGDVSGGLDVDLVAEDLEVVAREALGIAPADSGLVLPLPQLDGEVLTAELLEGEFAKVADSLPVDVVGSLNDRLMMRPFSVDLVGRVEIHGFKSLWSVMKVSSTDVFILRNGTGGFQTPPLSSSERPSHSVHRDSSNQATQYHSQYHEHPDYDEITYNLRVARFGSRN
jgi:hypothetical protein